MMEKCSAKGCTSLGTIRVRLRNPDTGRPDPQTVYACAYHHGIAKRGGILAALDETPRPSGGPPTDTPAPGSGTFWVPSVQLERRTCPWCAGRERLLEEARRELEETRRELTKTQARLAEVEAEADRLAEEADRLEAVAAELALDLPLELRSRR